MTFTPGSPLDDSEEGLKEIIEERDKRLKELYDEVTYRDQEFKQIQEDRTQAEFDKANRGINFLYEIGKAGAEKYVPGLGQLFDFIIAKSQGKDVPFPVQLLLKEQKDLPKDKTKGLLPSESGVPLDVIEQYPSIQEMYETKGLDPNQKGMLQSIFSRVTGKSEKELVLDPEDKYFGAIKKDVETAEGYYGTPPRAFFNKRKIDKRGRIFDLATGEFNVNELARRYPGKKNQGFRREVQALAVDERFTLTTFAKTRNEIIEDWFDGLEAAKGAVDNPARDLEAHHIRSIRHMGALMSDMNRSERVRFNKILWKNAMGVGHNPANIILLSSNRFNDIHGRLHDKLDEQIGKYAEKLIDPNKKYTFAEKIEIAKRMGQVTNRYTFEAYEEMADYLDSLMLKASPAAEMAAKMDIAELEARLDFRIDELQKAVNKEGYASLAKQIQQIPGSSIGLGQIPADYEDEDPSLFQRTRLVRGPGKKTIERQKRYETLYGKQGSLF